LQREEIIGDQNVDSGEPDLRQNGKWVATGLRPIAVVAFRLDLYFLSDILNWQVTVIDFCEYPLPLNLLKDDVSNFWECWLSVSPMLETSD
jgi:hypothetical protein